jgi:Mg-chelatase subunit ChlD
MEHIILGFDNRLYKLNINQSGKNTRQIRNITLCIDISGSMNTLCTVQDCECDGFSRFDLIKHCIYLILEMLTENDTLTIITFNYNAMRLFSGKLTIDNKQTIKDKLAEVYPSNATNIWAALQVAYNLDDEAKRLELELPDEIYLLSDGEANNHPPGGIEYCFQNLYQNEKYKKVSLHALGLSNENDSRLLYQKY